MAMGRVAPVLRMRKRVERERMAATRVGRLS